LVRRGARLEVTRQVLRAACWAHAMSAHGQAHIRHLFCACVGSRRMKLGVVQRHQTCAAALLHSKKRNFVRKHEQSTTMLPCTLHSGQPLCTGRVPTQSITTHSNNTTSLLATSTAQRPKSTCWNRACAECRAGLIERVFLN
jgi:hypothetical protein